jgi:hypothetical protein
MNLYVCCSSGTPRVNRTYGGQCSEANGSECRQRAARSGVWISARVRDFLFVEKRIVQPRCPPRAFFWVGIGVLCREYRVCGRKLTTDLCLVPRWRIGGAVHLLLLWTATFHILTFYTCIPHGVASPAGCIPVLVTRTACTVISHVSVGHWHSRYSDLLWAGLSGDWTRVGTKFTAPVQTGSEANPASCRIGTGPLPGVKRLGRGINHQPPRMNSRTVPLLPLLATLCCCRASFTFTFTSASLGYLILGT